MNAKTPVWWQSINLVSILLLPLSLLFGLLSYQRRKAYQWKVLTSYRSPVPVIIIGNISVGGTGKTPLLIHIINTLKKQGYNPGVVSRGYGGSYQTPTLEVTSASDVLLCGDESLLIAQQTRVPVFIAKKRILAVKKLVEKYSVDCILSDDGLQHYALQRDLEVVVIDAEKRFGNKLLLPAGPLRESVKRLTTVDVLISQNPQLKNEFKMKLKVNGLVNLKTGRLKPVSDFIKQPVIALAGIGNPQKFYNTLEAEQIILDQRVDFPDHHAFQVQDIQFESGLPIIMTEKDAIKCTAFATEQHWYLAIEMQTSANFIQLVSQVIN